MQKFYIDPFNNQTPMKKLLLLVSALVSFLGANAGLDFPKDFEKNFEFNQSTLDGWTIYAREGVPSGEYSTVFENYKTHPYALAARFANETLCFLWSNSEYSNRQPSDTWFISPEFEVTLNTEMLSFLVCVIGVDNTTQNNISVYISDNGGVEKEDFKLLKSTTMQGSIDGIYFFETQQRRMDLSGYKGKKVRLAFVNEGNSFGIMGFGDIQVSSWYAGDYPSPDTFDQIIMGAGAQTSFNLNMGISTPVTTTRYDVDFETSSGFKYNASERAQLRLAGVTNININIPGITLNQAIENFKLTVTPQFDGAVPFVLTGSYVTAERLYNQVALMEEATGTWCGWCPYGAIALEYYSDKYPVEGDGDKVITVALHDGDSMQINPNISEYNEVFKYLWGIESYPNLLFNRARLELPSPYPNIFGSFINEQFAQRSFVYGKLDKVYLNPEDDSDMVAEYSITSTYDSSFRPMNVSVVITEDDVTGMGASYIQTNYLPANTSTSIVLQELGSDWLPYFEFYLNHGESILPTEMVYNHVARACYPSFTGKAIPDFGANETYTGKIYFPLPANVNDRENMKVSLIITDAKTGEFITGDQMSYADFTMESGVNKVSDNTLFDCKLVNHTLNITSSEDGVATLYAPDGRMLKRIDVKRGSNSYPVDFNQPIVILNMGRRIVKLMNR